MPLRPNFSRFLKIKFLFRFSKPTPPKTSSQSNYPLPRGRWKRFNFIHVKQSSLLSTERQTFPIKTGLVRWNCVSDNGGKANTPGCLLLWKCSWPQKQGTELNMNGTNPLHTYFPVQLGFPISAVRINRTCLELIAPWSPDNAGPAIDILTGN